LAGGHTRSVDTKLARETKGNTILQLCLLTQTLAGRRAQGPCTGRSAYVVVPGTAFVPEGHRLADFRAYYRRVRASLEAAVGNGRREDRRLSRAHRNTVKSVGGAITAKTKRRQDDHPSLIAGISKLQTQEFERRGAPTMAAIAGITLAASVEAGSRRPAASFEARARNKPGFQVAGRKAGSILFEALDLEARLRPVQAFRRLHLATIFLDLEGDPFVEGGGLEYLFGYAFRSPGGAMDYRADWANDAQRGGKARVRAPSLDFAVARQREFPDLHIYHFAPYEPASAQAPDGGDTSPARTSSTSCSAEKVFTDLYAVVRPRHPRPAVESYSIKRLEPFVRLPAAPVALTDSGPCACAGPDRIGAE